MDRVKSLNRLEFKYLLNRAQYYRLCQELGAYMVSDPHSNGQQSYKVTSLYYDTADYRAYQDKMDGLSLRRKIRVRAYGHAMVTPQTPCFVEIKQHFNHTISKKRVILPYAAGVELFEVGGNTPTAATPEDRAVIEEIQFLAHTMRLQPACVISYQRLAFNGTDYDPGLRVTFDTSLTCRSHDLTLLTSGHADNHYLLSPEWSVMEVKVNHRVPYWLMQLIGKYGCARRRVSKYCAALDTFLQLRQRQRIFIG